MIKKTVKKGTRMLIKLDAPAIVEVIAKEDIEDIDNQQTQNMVQKALLKQLNEKNFEFSLYKNNISWNGDLLLFKLDR